MLSVPIKESALRVQAVQVSIDGVDSITTRLEMNDEQQRTKLIHKRSRSAGLWQSFCMVNYDALSSVLKRYELRRFMRARRAQIKRRARSGG
jgi:hypothetical protein